MLSPCPSIRWPWLRVWRSEEHTSELQSRSDLVCRLLLEKKKKYTMYELRGDVNSQRGRVTIVLTDDCTKRKTPNGMSEVMVFRHWVLRREKTTNFRHEQD